MDPVLANPFRLVELINQHAPPIEAERMIASSPLGPRATTCLLTLRRLGYDVQPLTRAAMARRNDDDNQFRHAIKRAADLDQGMLVLIDAMRADRTEEQENFTAITVVALRVSLKDHTCIVDAFGNESEQEMLIKASRDSGREPGYYTGKWEPMALTPDEQRLERLCADPQIDRLVAICQSAALQSSTEPSPNTPKHRRI